MNEIEAGTHVDACAFVVQLSDTGAENPAIGVTTALVVILSPATTDPEPGESPSEKSTPLPVSAVESPVYAAAEELTVSVPFRAPVAVGLKVTLIVHVPSAAIVLPQVVVTAKSPVVKICGTGTAAVAAFVNVTTCGVDDAANIHIAEVQRSRRPRQVRYAGPRQRSG